MFWFWLFGVLFTFGCIIGECDKISFWTTIVLLALWPMTVGYMIVSSLNYINVTVNFKKDKGDNNG